jgi:lipoprotein-anchoring transpeptidase ErfK/SrfK
MLSRRDFVKLSGLGLVAFVSNPWHSFAEPFGMGDFPNSERLGRVIGGKVAIKLRPDIDSPDVGTVFDDDIVIWSREVIGKRPLWYSQRFVETPAGFIYAPNLQPVRNRQNLAIKSLPGEGFWAEVTVPYVDLLLANPPARSPWVKNTTKPRLYYSQVMWIDQIKTDDAGQVLYRVKEKYGTFGDIFWAPAEGFRLITTEDISPISPDIEDKQVKVNLTHQTLSCFEGNREVYFCPISTGGKWDKDGNPSDEWATPSGAHSIWRKLVSVHMTGGTTGGGYDLAGIGWTTLFSSNGVAVHSTFWHNSFGIPKSHGCVNARPEDAQWIFRWTNPAVPYFSGDITISGRGSTKVIVTEG